MATSEEDADAHRDTGNAAIASDNHLPPCRRRAPDSQPLVKIRLTAPHKLRALGVELGVEFGQTELQCIAHIQVTIPIRLFAGSPRRVFNCGAESAPASSCQCGAQISLHLRFVGCERGLHQRRSMSRTFDSDCSTCFPEAFAIRFMREFGARKRRIEGLLQRVGTGAASTK